ncbi:Vacuolar protein sorting-associated protein Ist1 protein [Dioscorea alata]|uniref:Vacuolar protein sorting-associated protein Ist1 protein n=1 Tax=Dioscorea alata TaxID=55571 RepID=A0ACB7WTV0_DIOAL|nr:Vacuolar protein sorting-associated protein Ist1 protein [Dioscorea alata]
MSLGHKSPSETLKNLVMGAGFAVLRKGFNPSKCKTEAKMAIARIKLLRNKREVQVRQMRRDIAMLLESRQEDTARIRVEHVIREQNVLAANEIIELFCELVVSRLSIIAKQRDCPADLREGISSLLYASPRCSEIPELSRIRDVFEKKYGKDFVSAAVDLRPNAGVNNMLIEKLSVRKPSGEKKLNIMREIAKEYLVEWDATESEKELLKPPEEHLEGPKSFVSASSMPVNSVPFRQGVQPSELRSFNDESSGMQFKDTASAVQAAADCAQKAASAAQAAAYLAQQSSKFDQASTFRTQAPNFSKFNSSDVLQTQPSYSTQNFEPNSPSKNQPNFADRVSNSQSFNNSNFTPKKTGRSSSYTVPRKHSDINFDDSDGLESESDNEDGLGTYSRRSAPPPDRDPPVPPSHIFPSEDKTDAAELPGMNNINSFSRVHPKLPDYDVLAARFEALKRHRNSTG